MRLRLAAAGWELAVITVAAVYLLVVRRLWRGQRATTGADLLRALAVAVPAAGWVWLETGARREPVWALLAAVPFAIGLVASLLLALQEPRTLADCVRLAVQGTALAALLLLGIGYEAAVGALFSLPIILPLSALGAAAAYLLQRGYWKLRSAPALLFLLLLAFSHATLAGCRQEPRQQCAAADAG